MDTCEHCNTELLYLATCTEPEELRSDMYCPECHIHYACYKHGLSPYWSHSDELAKAIAKVKRDQLLDLAKQIRFAVKVSGNMTTDNLTVEGMAEVLATTLEAEANDI